MLQEEKEERKTPVAGGPGGHFQGEAGLGLSCEFLSPNLSSTLLVSKTLAPLHPESWGDHCT